MSFYRVLALFLLPVALAALPAQAGGRPTDCAAFLGVDLTPRTYPERVLQPARGIEDLVPGLQFGEVAGVAFKLLELYPADRYYFVGLGRSPFPILDLIELVAPQSTVHVPISYYRILKPRSWFFRTPPHRGELDPYSSHIDGRRENFFKHLDRHLPEWTKQDKRIPVFIDYADFGNSLAKFSVDFKAYAESRGQRTEHRLVFMSAQHHTDYWYLELLSDYALSKQVYLKIMSRTFYWQLNRYPETEKKLRSLLPEFTNLYLSRHSERLARVLDREEHKAYSPYAHFDANVTSKDYQAEYLLLKNHAYFTRVLEKEFKRAYESSTAFQTKVDLLRLK